MDQFEASFSVFVREVGAHVHDFFGDRPGVHVPDEVVTDAARTLLLLARSQGNAPEMDPEDSGDVAATRREIMAQACEETWEKLFAPVLCRPEKRVEALGFFEQLAGRPMPLPESA